MGAYELAKSGHTTWDAPVSGSERDLFYAAGMQPYSVKIGNNWVSYSKLGPLSYPIAMASALANAEKKNPDKKFIENVGTGVSGILGFFGDQSYVRSIGDLVDAIRGGGNMGSAALTSEASNLTGQLIPYHSFLTWLGRATDPTYYKASNFSEKLMKDLPILSKNLQSYTDLQGNPSKRDYPGINAVSPYQVTKEKAPEATMLQDMQTKKINNAVQKRADEAFQSGDTTQQNAGGVFRYVNNEGSLKKVEPITDSTKQFYITNPETGNKKFVDIGSPIPVPAATGVSAIDKLSISAYKSDLTARIKDIYTLQQDGQLTVQQASEEIDKIQTRINSFKTPKKVSPKKITVPKTKLSKAQKIKGVKFKGVKLAKSKIKLGKVSKSKAPKKLAKTKLIKINPLKISQFT
jgi:hypothetical protein